MILPNIENFIGCDSSFEEAEIVLYGAPFDSTTSFRPGARFGPSAIRHESFGLETYSPYQDRDLTDIQVFDSGDLELPIGDTEKVLAEIQDCTEIIFKQRENPVYDRRRASGDTGCCESCRREISGTSYYSF